MRFRQFILKNHSHCTLNCSIAKDPLESSMWHPPTVARQLGAGALCRTCKSGSQSRVRGGGHFAHRYAPERGFLCSGVLTPAGERIASRLRAACDEADRRPKRQGTQLAAAT
jgi:uncharacterized protein